MFRVILGVVLVLGGIVVLALSFGGFTERGWVALSAEEMTNLRGGHFNCARRNSQACEGHWGNCGTACELDPDDDPEAPKLPQICVNRERRRYKEGTFQPSFPLCGKEFESGFMECEEEKTKTVCFQTHICAPYCKLDEFDLTWKCHMWGNNVEDHHVRETYDVDEGSGPCPETTEA